MALSTFTPPIAPSPGTAFKATISINQADFGDGYTQASAKGLNHIRETVDLRWDGLTEAQFVEIRTFFEAHGGYLPFWYQVRGRAAPMRWTCAEWSGADSAPWTFTAKLSQDFSAGT